MGILLLYYTVKLCVQFPVFSRPVHKGISLQGLVHLQWQIELVATLVHYSLEPIRVLGPD